MQAWSYGISLEQGEQCLGSADVAGNQHALIL
jgi:hypothetical protein